MQRGDADGSATVGTRHGRTARGWPRVLPLLLLPLVVAAAKPPALRPPRHTVLQATYPAADSVHHGDLLEVRLRYSTAVQTALSTITLTGPGGPLQGVSAVETVPGTDDREIRVRLSAPPPSGAYTVRWTTAGPDSHPLSGSFAFTVDRPEPVAAEPAPAAPGGDPQLTATEGRAESGEDARDPAGVFVRATFLLSVLGMLGAPLFVLAVLGPLAADSTLAEVVRDAAGRTRALAWGVAGLFVFALPGRLWKQSADLFGADALTGESVGRILGTGWGSAWLLQAAMGVLFVAGLVATRRERARPAGWWMMLAAGLGSAVVPALSGHAAATPGGLRSLAILNDTIHVAAAGAWMGTLAVLALVGLRAMASATPAPLPAGVGRGWNDAGGDAAGGFAAAGAASRGIALAPVARMVNAFSRTALVAVSALALTGLVSAWLQVGSPAALFGSGYGRTLLVKLALVAAAAALGLYNWRVVRPSLAGSPDGARIRRSAGFEALLGLAVVVVTALLIATPLP